MNRELASRYMSLVHPMLRPWVWLQLFFIYKWMNHHQRALVIMLTKDGRVHIRYIGDAPKAANTYSFTPPAMPAWDRPAHHIQFSQSVIPEVRVSEISGTQPILAPNLHPNPG